MFDQIQEGCEDKTVLHQLEHIAKSDGEVGDQTHFVIISSKEYVTGSKDNNPNKSNSSSTLNTGLGFH